MHLILFCLGGNSVGLGGRIFVHLIVLYPPCDKYLSVRLGGHACVRRLFYCYFVSLAVTHASAASSGDQ